MNLGECSGAETTRIQGRNNTYPPYGARAAPTVSLDVNRADLRSCDPGVANAGRRDCSLNAGAVFAPWDA